MYRSYTKFFKIFGCVNKFLQNWKITALFKIRKYKIALFSLLLSLTAGPHLSSPTSGLTVAATALTGTKSPTVRSPATRLAPTRSTRSRTYSGVADGSWDDRRRALRRWQRHGGPPVKRRRRTEASPTTVKASLASPHSGEHGTAANRTKRGF